MDKKKWKNFLAFILTVHLVILSGCDVSDKEQSQDSVQGNNGTTFLHIENISRKLYQDASRQNSNIQIFYPVFNSENMESVNQKVYDFVKKVATDIYGQDYTDLEITMDFDIKRYDENIVSIVYTGQGNVTMAAYPNSLFVSQNISIKEDRQITLSDVCMIDDAFVDTVKQAVSREYSGDRLNAFLEYYDNESDLLKSLLACDMSSTECQSYYTESCIGLSIPVQHFNGDHLDVEIPFSQLEIFS